MNIGSQQQVLIQYKFHFVFLLCLRFDIWEFFKTILLFNFASSHFALFVCMEKYLKTWIKYKILGLIKFLFKLARDENINFG